MRVYNYRINIYNNGIIMAIAKDTKILTKFGLKFIQNISNDDYVLSKDGWCKVISNENISSECVEIFDDYGFSITTSIDQKYVSNSCSGLNIVCADELSENSNIAILPGETYYFPEPILENHEYIKNDWGNLSNRLKLDVTFPEIISEEMAYFLGYSYGDGYVNRQKGKLSGISLACSDEHPDIKTKLSNIISSLFNVDVKICKGDGALENVKFFSISVVTNLEKNGILKQKAGSLLFPEKIFYADTKIQCAFISGYFDADGCAQKSKKSYRIDSCDYDILKTFQLICFANGIVSRLSTRTRENENVNWRPITRLGVVGANSIKILKHLFTQSYKIYNSAFSNTRDGVITMYNCEFLKLPYSKFSYVNNVDPISYTSYTKIQETTDLIKHKPLIKSFVRSIDNVGIKDTWELVVDGEGFWANGFYLVS